jgi:hypothetical protein
VYVLHADAAIEIKVAQSASCNLQGRFRSILTWNLGEGLAISARFKSEQGAISMRASATLESKNDVGTGCNLGEGKGDFGDGDGKFGEGEGDFGKGDGKFGEGRVGTSIEILCQGSAPRSGTFQRHIRSRDKYCTRSGPHFGPWMAGRGWTKM